MRILKAVVSSTLTIVASITLAFPVIAGPYEDGIEANSNRDYATSFPAFKQAVAEGHVKAHLRLANNYRFGKGTKKSGTKAIALYKKAAELGEVSAYGEIAQMYEYGEGVAKSPTKVAEWAKKGAEAGHYMGQYKYAQALQQGKGIEKNEAKALYWFQKASAQGHMMSQGAVTRLTNAGVTAWQPPNTQKIIPPLQVAANKTPVTPSPTAVSPVQQTIAQKTIPSPTDRIKTADDLFEVLDISLRGNRMMWADDLVPKEEAPGQDIGFRFTKDLILPPSFRNSDEKTVSDTFIPNHRFATLASSKKKAWGDKKRPKDGTGYGKYLQGPYTTVGNWINYRLDGEFKHYYKNALVFEGEAENGIIKQGTSYKLEYFFPLYSSSYSNAEFAEIIRTQKGTYSVPIFSGNWVQSSAQANGYATYAYGAGTEFYSRGPFSRPPQFEYLRVTQRKLMNGKSVPHGISVQMKMVMWDGVYYHELETISGFKDGLQDGPYIDFKDNWDVVITDFKDGKYAGTNLTVIDKEDRSVSVLPFRNLKPNKWMGIDNHFLQFRSVRAQAEIDRKIREAAARKKAKEEAEERHILTASKQTGFDYYEKGDFRRSYRILHRYARQGEADAQNLIGLMHQYGYGQTVNMRVAKDYLLQASNQNFPAAQYNLGWIYYHVDNYQSDRDMKQAKFWLGKSADNGFASAIEALAIIKAEEEPARIAARQDTYYKKNKWSFSGMLAAAAMSGNNSYSSGRSGSSPSYSGGSSYSPKTYSDPFGGLNPYDSEYQTVREIKCRACTYQNRYD